MMNIYDFNVLDALGNEVSLREYGNQNFVVLDFPCNQFANQAPGSIEEIVNFCDSTYGITFPIFDKIDVNGENESSLYTYLKAQKGFEGFDEEHELTQTLMRVVADGDSDYMNNNDIKWNFTKFLVDKKGNVVARFEPTTDMLEVKASVEQLLAD